METTGTDYSGTLASPWQGARQRGENGQLAPYDSFSIFRPLYRTTTHFRRMKR